MVFVSYSNDPRRPDIIHTVSSISLQEGEQGIPIGFDLWSRCGDRLQVSTIEFFPEIRGGAVKCPFCTDKK